MAGETLFVCLHALILLARSHIYSDATKIINQHAPIGTNFDTVYQKYASLSFLLLTYNYIF